MFIILYLRGFHHCTSDENNSRTYGNTAHQWCIDGLSVCSTDENYKKIPPD